MFLELFSGETASPYELFVFGNRDGISTTQKDHGEGNMLESIHHTLRHPRWQTRCGQRNIIHAVSKTCWFVPGTTSVFFRSRVAMCSSTLHQQSCGRTERLYDT